MQTAGLSGARAVMGELADAAKLRERIGAALKVLESKPEVAPNEIAAIGFCFGGITELEFISSPRGSASHYFRLGEAGFTATGFILAVR
jgi:dienelactone hydrolase